MTVFLCARCSAELTPDLTVLPTVPDAPDDSVRRPGQLAPSTMPPGHYVIDARPWGSLLHEPSAAAEPANTVLVNPDDVPSLQPLPGHRGLGCCGPSGDHGRNRACRCGVALATLIADCLGPYELHLDPLRVFPLD